MSRPVWTSKDEPPVVIDPLLVRANQGNWMQGQGGEPLVQPRFIFRWKLDDGPWSGETPPSRSRPEVKFSGEGDNTISLAPGVHRYAVAVIAGNFYSLDGGWTEWGSGNVVTDEPYVVTFDATGPGGPPPPPPSSITIPRTALEADVKELEASLGYRLGWGRVVRPTRRLRARLG